MGKPVKTLKAITTVEQVIEIFGGQNIGGGYTVAGKKRLLDYLTRKRESIVYKNRTDVHKL